MLGRILRNTENRIRITTSEMDISCEDIVGDIEDLISFDDPTPAERYQNRKDVTVRAKRAKVRTSRPKEVSCVEKPLLDSVIPETQQIYMKTWGCAHNTSDTEYMAGQLAQYGYNLTNDKNSADLWVLNSCTVKNPSEDTFRNEIEAAHQAGKHVVVAGCVPQAAPRSDYLKGLSVVGVQQIDRVAEVVEETLKGHSVRLLQAKKVDGRKVAGPKLALPKVRKNPLIEVIPINSGCLNACTYCKTKFARADLVSYPVEEIVDRARQVFQEGVCEIWLTSEDTGTYGRDIGSSLPELLWQLVEEIPEGCMMRLGMTNPPYILEHLDEMAKILSHPRVYSFLHIPVQSGSDTILGDMKREYCVKDFERMVDFLRAQVPGITIATDIICGFPGETEADFDDTLALCRKYQFPSLFINQFFPRPGTPAAKMTKVPANEVKTRTKRLTDLFHSYEPYKKYELGTKQTVLVTEISHDRKHYVGHNKFYEQILLPMHNNLLGKQVKVEITGCTKFSMFGKVIQDEREWVNCSKPNTVGDGNTNPKLVTDPGESKFRSMVAYLFISCSLAIVCKYIFMFFDF